MYIDLKKHWDAQYPLSANKVFADFQYYLEHGGAMAHEFVKINSDFTETVIGCSDAAETILEVIDDNQEPSENQAYFFDVAMDQMPHIRTLLQRKYDASVRYCEQERIPINNFTPESLLPGVRRAEGLAITDETQNITLESKEIITEESIQQPTEESLKSRIDSLRESGASKTKIWESVAEDAKAIGFTRNQAWAYVDNMVTE